MLGVLSLCCCVPFSGIIVVGFPWGGNALEREGPGVGAQLDFFLFPLLVKVWAPSHGKVPFTLKVLPLPS